MGQERGIAQGRLSESCPCYFQDGRLQRGGMTYRVPRAHFFQVEDTLLHRSPHQAWPKCKPKGLANAVVSNLDSMLGKTVTWSTMAVSCALAGRQGVLAFLACWQTYTSLRFLTSFQMLLSTAPAQNALQTSQHPQELWKARYKGNVPQ